ncbi:MAG: response regulator transcription factor [Candidatus Omnitrophota bacterium]|nr:response regulator transcription factor [Candidatus Omnitrophota bacterium]
MPLSIVIADDHDIIREGIKNILAGQPDYKIIAEAVDGEDVLSKAEQLKPDILLLDISMPKISGIDIISQIHIVSPKTKIIIITVHKANAYIMKAFRSGINGYLHKENAAEDLLPALRKVARGGTYLSSTASSYLIDKTTVAKPEQAVRQRLLTSREEEILRLVAAGKTARQIAQVLFISPRTVENYKNLILKKLGLHKTSDLIKYAIKHKIIEIEEEM